VACDVQKEAGHGALHRAQGLLDPETQG